MHTVQTTVIYRDVKYRLCYSSLQKFVSNTVSVIKPSWSYIQLSLMYVRTLFEGGPSVWRSQVPAIMFVTAKQHSVLTVRQHSAQAKLTNELQNEIKRSPVIVTTHIKPPHESDQPYPAATSAHKTLPECTFSEKWGVLHDSQRRGKEMSLMCVSSSSCCDIPCSV